MWGINHTTSTVSSFHIVLVVGNAIIYRSSSVWRPPSTYQWPLEACTPTGSFSFIPKWYFPGMDFFANWGLGRQGIIMFITSFSSIIMGICLCGLIIKIYAHKFWPMIDFLHGCWAVQTTFCFSSNSF
jgi:hypothetical protein